VSVATQPSFAFGSPRNLPAASQNNRLSTDVRSYDILPDGRFIGLVVASGSDVSKAAAAPPFSPTACPYRLPPDKHQRTVNPTPNFRFGPRPLPTLNSAKRPPA